ncbi:MAG TPA: DNA-binding transcriptional regulator Fis [Plasticicumulans sp.]|nr:DNA-binding transcriptional regulator Fis [Plasticicumulans sp.]
MNPTDLDPPPAPAPAPAPLRAHVQAALHDYFRQLEGQMPTGLYDLVLQEVERPLLETVMHFTHGNQTRAAEVLGINRSTLRKKLRHYGLE